MADSSPCFARAAALRPPASAAPAFAASAASSSLRPRGVCGRGRCVATARSARSLGAAAAACVAAAAAARRAPRPGRRLRTRVCLAATRRRGDEDDEEVDQQLAESLKERTLQALDFDYVVERLRENCWTAAAVMLTANPADLMADNPEEARKLYRAVAELTQLEDEDLNLSNALDIESTIDECSAGTVVDVSQMKDVSAAVEALLKLRNGLERAAAEKGLEIPTLLEMVERIELPDEVLDALLEAFGEDGELSEKKFPQLKEMRERIRELEAACASTIKSVLASGKYLNYLSDDGYMQIGGSYVLSVKPYHRNKVGKMVDESRSGRTVYVEPFEVVELSSELIQLQRELKFTIRRILGRMCVAVSRCGDDLKDCLRAAGEVDLARARLFLGEDMEGEIPEIGDEGIIEVKHARNPCLLLRGGMRVVGYRLELGTYAQGLILSGPNAGGKTVVLKTAGLLALLARCGIPVPGGENPRVDFFEVVLAEIGDMQTIVDDLSTYSAHLVASRLMLQSTAKMDSRALVMLDEAGTGTDPAQGAALARAVIEAFLESGSRIVATTHSMQLKNWALTDERTEIAAMEYKAGKPTFRITRNEIGESHAIETALRLKLPRKLVERAESLLDEDQQSLLALNRRAQELEVQLKASIVRSKETEAEAEDKKAELQDLVKTKQAQLEQREKDIEVMEVDLFARQERLRSQLEKQFQARQDEASRKLKGVLQELKSSVTGLSTLKIVGDSIEDLRLERDALAEAEAMREANRKLLPGALKPEDSLSINDWVVVLARTPWYGFKGRVQRQMGTRVTIRIEGSGDSVDMDKTELGKTTPPVTKAAVAAQKAAKPVQHRDFSKVRF